MAHFKLGMIGVVGRHGGAAGSASPEIVERFHSFLDFASIKETVAVESDTYFHFKCTEKYGRWNDRGQIFNCGPVEYMLTHAAAGCGIPSILVVFGGDGTMLGVARQAAKLCKPGKEVPILGINHGRVGFITDVPGDTEPHQILKIMRSHHVMEERLVLSVDITGEEDVHQEVALNEVLLKSDDGKIIEFEVYVDEQFAYRSRADGVMVATPTGSTAYAMSAGGPILHPSAKVIEIIPMFPQTMSYRPLVLSDSADVAIKLVKGSAKVYVDGTPAASLGEGHLIDVSKHRSSVKFMHPMLALPPPHDISYNHFNTLRTKLNWHREPGN